MRLIGIIDSPQCSIPKYLLPFEQAVTIDPRQGYIVLKGVNYLCDICGAVATEFNEKAILCPKCVKEVLESGKSSRF